MRKNILWPFFNENIHQKLEIIVGLFQFHLMSLQDSGTVVRRNLHPRLPQQSFSQRLQFKVYRASQLTITLALFSYCFFQLVVYPGKTRVLFG